MKDNENESETDTEAGEDLLEIEETGEEIIAVEIEVVEEVEETREVAPANNEVFDEQLDATRLYLSEIGFSPLLSAAEEVHFARLAQRGDADGRRRMIESNLRLVVKIARRYLYD